MTEVDKTDAILRMMDMHFAKFRQTRDIEFKINLALWTVLVVLGKFLIDQQVMLDRWGWLIYANVSLLIIIGHYFCWMKPIQSSEDRDSDFVENCRKEVQKQIETNISYSYRQDNYAPKWVSFEVGFSGVILGAIALILSAA